MKTATIDLINELFTRYQFMKGGSANIEDIVLAENALGVRFSSDYREFLALFGGGIVGPYPIFGVRRSEPMDEQLWSVVDVTKNFRLQSWPGAEGWYIISMDHAGNPIGVDDSGKVHSYDHDAGVMVEVAKDVEAFLLKCMES